MNDKGNGIKHLLFTKPVLVFESHLYLNVSIKKDPKQSPIIILTSKRSTTLQRRSNRVIWVDRSVWIPTVSHDTGRPTRCLSRFQYRFTIPGSRVSRRPVGGRSKGRLWSVDVGPRPLGRLNFGTGPLVDVSRFRSELANNEHTETRLRKRRDTEHRWSVPTRLLFYVHFVVGSQTV